MSNTLMSVEQSMAAQEADVLFDAVKYFDAVWKRAPGFTLELPWEVARAFIKRIDKYNEFDAVKVLEALDAIDQIMPRRFYGEGNPNNGERDYTITVGRERSPVIYIERYELHRYGAPDVPLNPEMIEQIKMAMLKIGLADEADCEVKDYRGHGMGMSYEIRFWWD